jgi:hypothetical protein
MPLLHQPQVYQAGECSSRNVRSAHYLMRCMGSETRDGFQQAFSSAEPVRLGIFGRRGLGRLVRKFVWRLFVDDSLAGSVRRLDTVACHLCLERLA